MLVNNQNKPENNISNSEEKTISEKSNCVGNEEKITGLKYKTVGSYYNIDTSKFDKSKFDGKINFYGSVIDGKITTNKIKNAEIVLYKEDIWNNNEHRDIINYDWYDENGKTFFSAKMKYVDEQLSNDTTGAIVFSIDDYFFYNTQNKRDTYSDYTLFEPETTLEYNLITYEVYPSVLQVNKASDITIDLVLEKSGNPTYVSDRTSNCLDTEYSYTTYIYVYDDVAFLFSFCNYKNMKISAVYYYPIEAVNDDYSQESIKKWITEYKYSK